MNFPGLNLNPQLEMILDARKVYRQVTEIQNKK